MKPVYAMRTDAKPRPDALAAGYPATGWVHEGRPPWRVITWPDPAPGVRVVEYDGDEDAVTMDELKAARRNATPPPDA